MRHKHERTSNRELLLILVHEAEQSEAREKEAARRQKRIEAGVRRLLEIADPAAMQLVFTERGTTTEEEKEMANQVFQIHVSKTFDIAGAAQDADGNAITLTNLAFTPVSGPIGDAGPDDNPADDNDTLITNATVGATDTLTFKADGSDGKHYQAKADVTLIAQDEVPTDFVLKFTERV